MGHFFIFYSNIYITIIIFAFIMQLCSILLLICAVGSVLLFLHHGTKVHSYYKTHLY